MKEIITGDWHVGNVADSWMVMYEDIDGEKILLPSKVAETFRQIDKVIDHVIKVKGKLKIVGDLTHTNRPIPLYEQMLIKRFNRLEKNKIPTVAFKGNHEESTANKDALAPFKQIEYQYVKFYDDITNIVDGDINWILIPHINKSRFGEDATDEQVTNLISMKASGLIKKKSKRNIILGHFHASGAVTGAEEFLMRGGINFYGGKKVKNYINWMFLGHIHKHQAFKCNGIKSVYTGSLVRTDFGEEVEAKGFLEYDTKTNKYQFIENDTTPYKTINIDFVKKDHIDLDEKRIKKFAGGKIVKLRFKVSDENKHKVNYSEIERVFSKFCFVARKDKIKVNAKNEAKEYSNELTPKRLLKDYLKKFEGVKKLEKEILYKMGCKILDEVKSNKKSQVISSLGKISLESITLQNFRCFEDVEVKFKDDMVAGIIGNYMKNNKRSNGSGKTTLLQAILWVLFGIYKKGDTTIPDKRLVKRGAKEAMGAVVLNIDGKRVRVKREKNRKKSANLELAIDGINKSDRNADTQELIENLIGMDYKLFTNTVFFTEKGNDGFCAATPTVRKDYLRDLLQLDVWDDALDIVKEESSGIMDDLSTQESEYNVLKERLDGMKIEKLKKERDTASKAIDTIKVKEEALGNKISKLKVLRDNKSLIQERVEEIEEKIDGREILIKALKKKISGYKKNMEEITSTPEKDINKLKIKIDKKRKDLKEKVEQMMILKGKGESIKEQIELLDQDGSTCSLCDHKLTETDKKKSLAKREKQLEKIREEYKSLKNNCQSLENDIDDLDKDLTFKVNENENLQNFRDKVEEVNKEIDSSTKEIASLTKDLEKVQKKLKEAKSFDGKKLKQLEQQESDLEEEHEQLSQDYGAANRSIKSYERDKKEITKRKKKLDVVRKEADRYSLLINILGKNGVSSKIISMSLDEIEDYANEILLDIDNGEKKIEFRTDKEVGKGRKRSIRDTLDIWIYDVTGEEGSYEEYSNGEGTTVNFAIRLALSKILAKRNNVWHGIIILDELFGPLDEFNKEQMIKVINHLRKHFNQVFVISHTDIKDAFDLIINIIKDGITNTSHLKKAA